MFALHKCVSATMSCTSISKRRPEVPPVLLHRGRQEVGGDKRGDGLHQITSSSVIDALYRQPVAPVLKNGAYSNDAMTTSRHTASSQLFWNASGEQ
jgi:hypothetical protein